MRREGNKARKEDYLQTGEELGGRKGKFRIVKKMAFKIPQRIVYPGNNFLG